MRLAIVLVATTAAACGHPPGSGGPTRDAPGGDGPGMTGDAPPTPHDAGADGSGDASPLADAFPAVLDVRIDCHNTCVLTANPAAIAVSAGTSFQVNWINVGDTECDVTKVDSFNHVPIVLGLEPGTSYHDPVHDWCGPQFTGTFDFEISICTIPSEIPVNCGS